MYLQFLEIDLDRVKVHNWEVCVLLLPVSRCWGGRCHGIQSEGRTGHMLSLQVDQDIEVLERCSEHLLREGGWNEGG